MTVATDDLRSVKDHRRLTLKEFLTYDDGTDTRYELVDGVLIEMGTESTINTLITIYLIFAFGRLGIPTYRIGIKQKIEVTSSYVTARDPDLIVHTEESFIAIDGRKEACLLLGEPNPLIVVEAVSPGTESTDNYQRDYVQKSREYANRGILEFWQVDAERKWIKVGTLKDRRYQFQTFQGNDSLVSPTFPERNLTAAQVLGAGRKP